MLNKGHYAARRAALLRKMEGESGILLFLGNVNSPAQYFDNSYKWRQDSNWLYFFGIDEPRFAATIDLDTGEECIYADDVDLDDIIWTGPMPSVRELADAAGISKTAPYGRLGSALAGRQVHFLPVSRHYNALLLGELLHIKPQECFSEGKQGCPRASSSFVKAVISLRLVKDETEIHLIDQACILGESMHTCARQGIRPGRIEQEIVGEMEAVALSRGWGVSFPTILTQHGEIFHCHSHDLPIEPGRLLVIDAGVESNAHYASDFTRTYPTSGRFTTRQREIYQLVFRCNEYAFGLIKPGVRYRDVHLAVATEMLRGLRDLGLVAGDPEEMAQAGTAGLFMPHGLGHNMGLDVHDMEDLGENLVGYDDDQVRSSQLGLGSLRMARRLQAGHVVTDEPGIYFIPALIRQWKQERRPFIQYDKLTQGYLDFGGIRLEDDILVTADGARRLGGRRLPIAPDDVEEAMRK